MSHDNNRTNKNEKDKKDREKKGKHIDITTTINNKPKCLPTIFRLINSKNYNIVYSWSSSSLCYALPGLLTHIVNGISIYACMIYMIISVQRPYLSYTTHIIFMLALPNKFCSENWPKSISPFGHFLCGAQQHSFGAEYFLSFFFWANIKNFVIPTTVHSHTSLWCLRECWQWQRLSTNKMFFFCLATYEYLSV